MGEHRGLIVLYCRVRRLLLQQTIRQQQFDAVKSISCCLYNRTVQIGSQTVLPYVQQHSSTSQQQSDACWNAFSATGSSMCSIMSHANLVHTGTACSVP
jgi:hypothetical protein